MERERQTERDILSGDKQTKRKIERQIDRQRKREREALDGQSVMDGSMDGFTGGLLHVHVVHMYMYMRYF